MTGARPSLQHEGSRARPQDGYTRFVNLMKFALPSMAFVIIVAVLFWPNFVSTGKQATDVVRDALTPAGLRNFAMESPVFVATDDQNRPYRLTATKARQIDRDATIVALDDPKAKIELTAGDHVRISARLGQFDRNRNRLTLSGDVNVFHSRQYRFRTAKATFDMKTNSAWGGSRVFAEGPKATIAAQGFLVIDKGMTVKFTGKTRVVLNLDREDLKNPSGNRDRVSAGMLELGQ